MAVPQKGLPVARGGLAWTAEVLDPSYRRRNMIAWWETEQPGKEARVVLIQFDLAGHSKWVEGQPQHIIPVAKSRAEFAKTLATLLAYEGFYPLFWLGDGGVFARRYSGEEDADTAVKAADGALKYF